MGGEHDLSSSGIGKGLFNGCSHSISIVSSGDESNGIEFIRDEKSTKEKAIC
jgi:hypothetical protein